MPDDHGRAVDGLEDGDGRLPTFVIAGTQRSGTTSLARWLGAHPQVYMTPTKELHFFDSDKPKTLADYRRKFAGWSGQAAVGEATPNYLFVDRAMAGLAETLPEAKVVVSLRQPVDRAYSHYWAQVARHIETRRFDEVVADEQAHPDTEVGTGMGGSAFLLARGLYHAQLERAVRHVPRHQVLVVLFDDLHDHPAATFAQLCRFLGIDEDRVPAEVGRAANGYRRFHSERVRRWCRRLPAPAADVIGHLNSRVEPYPPIDPGLRRELLDWFRPANQALATWLDRDLSAWDS